MNRRIPVFAACLLFCVFGSLRVLSQGSLQFKSSPGAPADSIKTVLILHDTVYRFVQKDSATGIVTMLGDVRLQQDRTIIYCDSMIRNSHDNFIEAFGHVRIFDGDSTNIYSEYMKYQALTKEVLFKKNVKLTDGKGVLTTNELQYDLNSKIGVYNHGGKVVNNGSVLTSEEATYFEATKDVLFKKSVVLRDPQYDLSADSLLYNTQSQISTFITKTFILFKDSTRRTVTTSDGFYDLRNRKAQFGKRPIITDGSQILTGDSVTMDDSTGISLAVGRARYLDTAQGLVIMGNKMINDKKKNTFLATQSPVMVIKQDKDSIYMTADTLFSGRLIDEEADERKLAIQDSLHQIYIDSLDRALEDSIHRVLADSLHRRGVDTLKGIKTDSAHNVIVKDQSHEIRSDSAAGAAAVGAAAVPVPPAVVTNSPADRIRTISGVPPISAHVNRSGKPVAAPPSKPPALSGQPATGPPTGVSRSDSSIAATSRRPRMHAAGRKVNSNPYTDDGRISSGRAAIAIDTVPQGPTDSTLRYIKGYHHVRIFSDSLQAVSDSLYYSGKDSIFRLFKDPVAWGSGHYQVTGDTIYMYTRNKKADRIYVFENALAINKVGPNFFNQIKGNTINGYFKDGQMDFMRAKGNAESIYYVSDDKKAYTGVNKAHADIIDMIFVNKELDRVVLRNDAEGSMIPFKKVDFDEMRLRGFKWQEERRPKSKEDLF
jgi:lipopolysaccharide export system protein LptA